MPRIQRPIDADGAVLNVAVEVGATDAADLRSRSLAIPQPFQTMGLVDTGASRTILHPMVVPHLGLMPRGFINVATAGPATAANVRVMLYDARVTLGGHGVPQCSIEAAEVVPATPTVLVIVGRDILERCALFFDGQNRSFSLWI